MVDRIKILFIVNPFSGIGRKSRIQFYLDRYLDHKKYDYSLVYTQAKGHAFELSQEASKKGFRVVVAVGGDGTINEVAKALVNTEMIMGIIPAGSGNGLARHIRIPLRAKRAIKLINKLNTTKIDTAIMNGHFFVTIAGIGFDALVAEQFQEKRMRGFVAYFNIVCKAYWKYKPQEYQVFINGHSLRIKALFVSLANANQFGNNVVIAPTASLVDGYIDICMVIKMPLWAILLYAPMFAFKQIHRIPYCRIIKGSNVKIVASTNPKMNIDGDFVQLNNEINVHVQPQSLTLIVPK